MKKSLLLLALLPVLCWCCASKKASINNKTVEDFDLERYQGKWYEIARLPNRFEKDLVAVTANYTLQDDGTVEVINRGRVKTLDGKLKESKGEARRRKGGKASELEVSFFLFFYGDYNVMELDPNYQWSLVGSSDDEYLWFLSRTPQMEDSVYQHMAELAKARGYDTTKLIRVAQPKE